jgi:hypothetical protein
MENRLRLLLLILIATGTCLTNWGCDPCSQNKGPGFVGNAYGTWRLLRIESSTRTQTQFIKPQTLTIAIEKGRLGGAVTRETLRSDTTTVEKLEWESGDRNCRELELTITYDNRQRRKYWISEQGQTLRATGYVDELGSKADTLMYFYERVP